MPQIGQRDEHGISLQPINGLTTRRSTIKPITAMPTPNEIASPHVSRRLRRISVDCRHAAEIVKTIKTATHDTL
eukprot:2050343-Pleurochrysis_carterae.AAC.1